MQLVAENINKQRNNKKNTKLRSLYGYVLKVSVGLICHRCTASRGRPKFNHKLTNIFFGLVQSISDQTTYWKAICVLKSLAENKCKNFWHVKRL